MTEAMAVNADTSVVSPAPTKKAWRRLRNKLMLRKKTRAAIMLGIFSSSLYYIFYLYSGDIRSIAEATNRGDKSLFLLPIGIAFVFSIVHGLFTDRFWEALGLTAKR
ncbi:MAG: hypothetical protein HOK06_01675 [Rhodospirillaceae bacterium]|jgi:hypothetical protein|nr:hypothetical protein [Rhodospirillaceae bacterium]MBT4464569.1 hypothetical protein [Rhodospirillaceae bacterium]MBT5014149.1 hypothetical protein [Rhodospirillaceae bacterium]MBT5308147.1 hypothetical protein [Rhodospirillaceae bacterium]MBT6406288.1 hypothetical protein [Rhodospirillaceae bacterium]